MLQVARGNMQLEELRELFCEGGNARVDFSVPGHGLMLKEVIYPEGFFDEL